MLPCVAEIVVIPCFRSEARPAELIAAMAGLDEAQVAELVRFGVEPSVNFPVATNCSEVPRATDGLAGVTVIETSVAGVTLTEAVPLTVPFAAVMVTGPPGLRPVPIPEELIEAMVLSEELQVT